MTLSVAYHSDAQVEVSAAFAHYEAEREGLGDASLDALDEVHRRIATLPGRFPFVPATSRQRVLFDRFPYLLVFEQRGQVLYVLAVAHQHREPLYWAYRN